WDSAGSARGHRQAVHPPESACNGAAGALPEAPGQRESASVPAPQPPLQTLNGLLQPRYIGGIRQADMFGRSMMAEVQAGGDGQMLGFDQMLVRALAGSTDAAESGTQRDGAFGCVRNGEPQLPQRRQQEVPARTEGFAPLLANSQSILAEGGQCRLLGQMGRADVVVLRQLLQLRHRIRGCNQPAQAPAGHAEVLGEAVQQ